MKRWKLFEESWFVSILICFAIAGAAFLFCSKQNEQMKQDIITETTIQAEENDYHL